MRKVISEPSFLGSTDIGVIELDAKSRDDIPALQVDLSGRGDAGGAVPPSGFAHPSGPSPGHGPPGDGSVADSGDGRSEAGSPVRL